MYDISKRGKSVRILRKHHHHTRRPPGFRSTLPERKHCTRCAVSPAGRGSRSYMPEAKQANGVAGQKMPESVSRPPRSSQQLQCSRTVHPSSHESVLRVLYYIINSRLDCIRGWFNACLVKRWENCDGTCINDNKLSLTYAPDAPDPA